MASGLDSNDDNSNYFDVQRRAFEILGFSVRGVGQQLRLRLARPAWAALLLLAIGSHLVAMLADALLNMRDLAQFTDMLASINQSCLSSFKMVMLIGKRRHLSELLARLQELNERAMAKPGESRELIRQQNQRDARLYRIFRSATYGTVLISAVVPLAMGVVTLLQHGRFEPRTPLEFGFWLDTTQWLYYWLVYVWGIFAIAAVGFVIVAADTLFLWLVRNIVLQFELLARQLRRGCSSRAQLAHCVQLHCVALELAQQLSELYTEIGFVQYTLSYLQLCTLSYRFSHAGWNPQMPFRAAFLLVVLAQLCAYCFGGEQIKQQSQHVAAEIYESYAWQTVPPRSRHMLQLMMLRAQRPAQVSGFMFSIDRPLLLWVSRSICLTRYIDSLLVAIMLSQFELT